MICPWQVLHFSWQSSWLTICQSWACTNDHHHLHPVGGVKVFCFGWSWSILMMNLLFLMSIWSSSADCPFNDDSKVMQHKCCYWSWWRWWQDDSPGPMMVIQKMTMMRTTVNDDGKVCNLEKQPIGALSPLNVAILHQIKSYVQYMWIFFKGKKK